MLKILNFFVIGLLAGLIVLYQYHRNQRLEAEIELLRGMVTGQATPGHHGTGRSSDMPQIAGNLADNARDGLQDEITSGRMNAITDAIARTSNAVVGINVVQLREVRNPFVMSDPLSWMLFDERLAPRPMMQQVKNLGSGFIISPDGYIVTNEHVVRDAAEIVVTTTAQNKYPARVVGTDGLLDMALLKIEATSLPIIPFANSDDVVVGEWAIAIGNPYGLFDVNDQPSVSVGVISAVHRDFESQINGRIYTDMIQTDAPINRGNSGGPLINAEGKAVGMNTLIFSESGGSVGIGFAIPSNRIYDAIDDLLKGGVNRRFWIGISARNLNPTYARYQGLSSTRGALVTGVEAGSAAAKAGMRVEDVILEINGRPVESAYAARDILASTDLRVGDQLTMKIVRKRKVLDVTMTLIPLPSAGQAAG